MRQFRSSTDSVFDIDEAVEGPTEVAIVAQAGPPQESTTAVDALAAPADDA